MGRPTSDQERDAWQLLLWSYRHELGLEDTRPTRHPEAIAPGDDDDKHWAHPTDPAPT